MESTRLLGSDQSGMIRGQFEELREENSERFTSLIAAVITLGILAIIGLIVGFIIIGIQGNNTYNRVKDIDSEVEDVWSSNSRIELELAAVKSCTEQIKEDIADLQNNTNLTMTIEQIVIEALNTFFPPPLPISGYLCAIANQIDLPNSENVLISANLTNLNLPDFPMAGVSYNSESGRINIANTLPNNQAVSVQIKIRALINQAGGEDGNEQSTYSLIMSEDRDCEFEDCPRGFYSTIAHFDPNCLQFSDNDILIEIDQIFTIQSDDNFRFFVFIRSNNGNGRVLSSESGDATPCSAFSISIQSVAPSFSV